MGSWWRYTFHCFVLQSTRRIWSILSDYVFAVNSRNLFNLYPGIWGGGKMPPVHFCLCISKTVRDTGMRFWDIVKDSEGYLSPYNIFTGNVNMVAWKPEVHFRKQRKGVCPILNLPIKSNRHFWAWAPDVNMLLAWFLAVSLYRKCNMADEYENGRRCMVWKMWLRSVRHALRTRRFRYHIRVLFTVVARVCRCVIIRESKVTPKTGNSKTFRYEQHICEIPTAIPIFSGGTQSKGHMPDTRRYVIPSRGYNYFRFLRDRDAVLVICRRHVPYVVVFVFLEFLDT